MQCVTGIDLFVLYIANVSVLVCSRENTAQHNNIALLGPSIIIIVNQPLQYVHQYSAVMTTGSYCSTELKCGSGSTAAYCSCANHIRPSYLRRPLPHPLHCADCRLLVLWLLVVPPLHYTCHFLCPQCEHIFSSNYHKTLVIFTHKTTL